jgi:hypothetical protein
MEHIDHCLIIRGWFCTALLCFLVDLGRVDAAFGRDIVRDGCMDGWREG